MTTLTAQKLTCSLCGKTSKYRWRFVLVAGQLVCRDIRKCRGQSPK